MNTQVYVQEVEKGSKKMVDLLTIIITVALFGIIKFVVKTNRNNRDVEEFRRELNRIHQQYGNDSHSDEE